MMQITLFLIVGLVVGVLLGWLWVGARAKVAETSLAETRTKQAELRQEMDAKSRDANSLQQLLRSESEHKAAALAELKQARASLEELAAVRGQLSNESQVRVAAETKLKEAEANLAEQKKLLEQATAKLTDTFGALSAEALKSNNQAFLALAKSTFETIHAQAKGDLEARQSAMDGVLNPLKEALGRYEKQASEMEKARQSAYGSLEEQLRSLSSTSQFLQQQTGSLVTALSTPQVRGRWGEMTLKRAAELAGMSEYCDFDEQASFWSEGGKQQRPDMIVKLPGGRRIIVDAKAPLQAFLKAAAATNEEDRKTLLAQHAQLVRAHVVQLASRAYADLLGFSPEIVVLFLPGESFFAAAVEQDHALIEDAMERKVVMATPTTLIALLRAIAYGWRQERLAENAQAISELGKQLYERIKTFVGHFDDVGRSLTRAVDAYNKSAGSLESRVLPSARRFKELGAAPGEEIVEISPVDESPRTLAFPEQNGS